MADRIRPPSAARQTGLVLGRALADGAANAPLAFVAPTLLAGFVAVMFTAVFDSVADTPGFPGDSFIGWIGPGAVLLTAFVGAGYGAGALVRDIQTGYLDRVRLLPVRPAALVWGRALFEAVRIVPPATVVLVVTLLLGVDNRAGMTGVVVCLGATVAVAATWNGIFFLVALRSRSHTAVLGLQPLFMPVVMLSTMFAPSEQAPGWFAFIVDANPFSSLLKGVRTSLAGDTDAAALAIGLAAFATVGVATLAGASRLITADFVRHRS